MDVLAGFLFMAMQLCVMLLAMGLQQPRWVMVPRADWYGRLLVVMLYLGLAVLFLVMGMMVKQAGGG